MTTKNKLEQAQQIFTQLSTTVDNVASMLQSRLEFVKNEEPQYRQQQ